MDFDYEKTNMPAWCKEVYRRGLDKKRGNVFQRDIKRPIDLAGIANKHGIKYQPHEAESEFNRERCRAQAALRKEQRKKDFPPTQFNIAREIWAHAKRKEI